MPARHGTAHKTSALRAAALLLAGAGALSVALISGLQVQPEDTTEWEAAVAAQKEINAAARLQTSSAKAEYQNAKPRLEAVQARNRSLQTKLHEKHTAFVALARQQAATLSAAADQREQNRQLAAEQAEAVRQAQARQQRDNAQKKNLTALLERYQHLVVTVASTEGYLGSGFFFDAEQRGTLVVTSLPPEVERQKLVVKIQAQLPGEATRRTLVAHANVLYSDPPTGLQLLAIDHPGLQVRHLRADSTATASLGQAAYALGTQLLGEELLEHNIFDGEISALNRQLFERTYLQVSIPANAGTRGAALIDSEGHLLGVLAGSTGGERSSLAIPASELIKAMERFAGHLARQRRR